jgi:hypothetical protein
MGKINSYPSAALPILTDKLIGTNVVGPPPDATYNFTLADLLALFEANFNAPAIVIASVPVYATNAAALAGGLVIGQLYRNGDVLNIVH